MQFSDLGKTASFNRPSADVHTIASYPKLLSGLVFNPLKGN